MHSEYERLLNCYQQYQKKIDFKPKLALVLGSGLGTFAATAEIVAELPYQDIEGFPVSTVAGHRGRFLFGYIGELPVVMMQGRIHYYEGYTMQDVVLPIRLMKLMGAKILFLTNAAGGVNPTFRVGDLMLITDQISSFVPSPLIGPNLDTLGPRFLDMSRIYDPKLQQIIREVAQKEGILLREGVYLQFSGPNYETPAEVSMASVLGADAVGMSTACEALAANHMGMRVCGISCVTNMACGLSEDVLNHEEVQKTANETAPHFRKLLTQSILQM